MTHEPAPLPQWRKSSYSGSGNNCVEVAILPGHIMVRDSKNLAGPELTFTLKAWQALTAGIKTDRSPGM
jgi:Domain of unknown function (DUF397)